MAIDSTGPKTGGLNQLNPAPMKLHPTMDAKAQDAKLREVAELYEEQFLREMVKAMRGTVPEGGLVKTSQGEQIYREQLDQNYVEQWGKRGGLGLQEIIYKQLMEKFGQKMGLRAMQAQPKGPIALDEKSKLQNPFAVKRAETLSADQLRLEFQKAALSSNQPQSLQAPWSGSVLGAKQINPNEYVLEMAHDNGLKSQFVFRGSLANSVLEPSSASPKSVQAGDTIGLLSPEAKSFFWTVSAKPGEQPAASILQDKAVSTDRTIE